MKETLEPFTRERFDELKARYEAAGYKVITRWRSGVKSIRLGDIVLGVRRDSIRAENDCKIAVEEKHGALSALT